MGTLADKTASGTGSIDERFTLSELVHQAARLVQVQVHFQRESGAVGDYLAPLVIRRYAQAGRRYDNEMRRLEAAGMGDDDVARDVNWRVPEGEREFYRLAKGDELRITWADPSAGIVAWGILVTLTPEV